MLHEHGGRDASAASPVIPKARDEARLIELVQRHVELLNRELLVSSATARVVVLVGVAQPLPRLTRLERLGWASGAQSTLTPGPG